MVNLGPYVKTGGGSSPDLGRALLREHALSQASHLLAAIEAKEPRPIPPFLAAVDRETDRLASRRVGNMLRAFIYFLRTEWYCGKTGPDVPPYLRVLDPMVNKDGSRLTSPALLVLQALLYSHTRWAQVHFHEASSAWCAYELLTTLEPRERAFVAALIAHQTLLRAAWNLHREAEGRTEILAFKLEPFAITNNPPTPETDYPAIASAIGRTLFAFPDLDVDTPDSRQRLSAALVLLSACLELRHQRLPSAQSSESAGQPPEAIRTIEDRLPNAFNFARWIAEEPEDPGWRLALSQFGHRVMENLASADQWDSFLKKTLQEAAGSSNITLSFDPTAPSDYWNQWVSGNSNLSLTQFRVQHSDPDNAKIAEAIEATVGLACRIGPTPREKLTAMFGITDPPHAFWLRALTEWINTGHGFYGTFAHILERLKQIFLGRLEELKENVLESEKTSAPFGYGYFPVPLMGRILRELHRIRPSAFSILRLEPKQLPLEASEIPFITGPLTIYLPDDVPPLAGRPGRQEAELIARYVAAMVVNLQVSLAPQQVELDFFSERARNAWNPLIQAALWANGQEGINKYLEQFRAEVCGSPTLDGPQSPQADTLFPEGYKPQISAALGIDIGASTIKCSLFKVTQSHDGADYTLALREITAPEDFIEFPTGTADNNRYRDATGFAKRVVKLIKESKAGWLHGLAAVGVAWPGAVRDGAYVAASSGILRHFQDFEGMSSDDLRKIHRLDLKQAFEDAFRRAPDPVDVVVTVLNDGDADVKGEERPGQQQWTEGVSVVLKQGTGTACGVYVAGEQVPILAEMGKAVLNLEPDRPWIDPSGEESTKPRPFPGGTLNNYCSKKCLSAIAKGLGWTAPEGSPAIDAREIGYFIENNEEKKKELRKRIAQEIVFARFANLFDGPRSIQGGDARLRLFYPDGFDLSVIGEARIEQLTERAPRDAAAECAARAGQVLADAIALLVEIFRCREVRLGGGPLSGSTGDLVTAAAESHLVRLYGFEVEPVPNVGVTRTDSDQIDPHVHASHALREVRKIRLVYPQTSLGNSGERGAARAALDAFVRETKRRALSHVRAYVGSEQGSDAFTAESLITEIEAKEPKLPVLATEVTDLLDTYMSSLGLSLQPPNRYLKSGRSVGSAEPPSTA